MTDSERKTLIEKCAKAMGFQVKGWIGDKLNYFDPINNYEGFGDWTPFDLADCAAMNAAKSVETGFNDFAGYAWAEVKRNGYSTWVGEDYHDHNGDKKAAWMMASARCVAATQESFRANDAQSFSDYLAWHFRLRPGS